MNTNVAGEDESIRSTWEIGDSRSVVFIVGLHRSGTTVLYEALSQAFAAAKLTIQDIVFYRALVTSHLRDDGHDNFQSLAKYFHDHQVSTRGRDSLSLSPTTAEEYGWILKKECGSYAADEASLSVLKDIVNKLKFIHPDADAILLKNPWDTGSVAILAAEFPDAKFVFIRRDPIEILNSELGNLLHFTENQDPLIRLLSRDIRDTRILLAVTQFVRKLIGRRLFSLLCIRMMFKDILNNVQKFNRSLDAAGSGRAVEITYAELVEIPKQTLETIASFLALPVDHAAKSAVTPTRRSGGLSPLVAEQEKALRIRLRESGVSSTGSSN